MCHSSTVGGVVILGHVAEVRVQDYVEFLQIAITTAATVVAICVSYVPGTVLCCFYLFILMGLNSDPVFSC